jgi:peptidoglycan hydrolase-like protein with peptidoglycan-binding domain
MQVLVLSGRDGVGVGRSAHAQSARPGDASLASTGGVDVRTIQRLLKQLSEGDPESYGAVNPGPVNGVANRRTTTAIRNFMRIKGIAGSPNIDRNLWSQLVSAQLDLPPMRPSARRSAATGECGLGVSASACADSNDAGATQGGTRQSRAPAPVDTRMLKPVPTPQKVAMASESSMVRRPTGADIPAIRFEKGRDRSFFIQLASLVSDEAARRHWRKISAKNEAILKKSGVAIEKAVLKGDRVYFRLLLGPFLDLPEARHVCTVLQRNKQKCLVQTRRGRAIVVDRAGIAATSARRSSVVASDRLPAPPPASPRRKVESAPLAPIPLPDLPKPASAATSRLDGMKNGDASPQRQAALTSPAAAPTAGLDVPDGAAVQSPKSAPVGNDSGPAVAALPASPVPDAAGRDDGAAKASNESKPRSDVGDHIAVLSKGVVVVPARGGNGNTSPIVGRRWFDVVFYRAWLFLSGWGGFTIAVLAAIWFIVAQRRLRRRSSQNSAFADALKEVGDTKVAEQAADEGDLVADILRDFDSAQLRESRNARDTFLQDVFEVTEVTAVPAEAEGSAMLVNTCLKDLLSKEPSKYKLIFLNWVFLNQVGVALNRKELLMEQLDRAIGREVDLVRSYFKLHLLELDHRHRLCDRLPGLFYCLQKTDS